jgi:hypothetical protein
MSRGLLDAIVGALIEARASPEAISAAVGAYEAWERAIGRGGRGMKIANIVTTTG